MIVAAAIRHGATVFGLPAPARHHDVLRAFNEKFGKPLVRPEQGFIDCSIGFVTREDAARIAVQQGQIDSPKWPPRLFSEDLW